jgi:hypothetical protein
MRFKKNERIPLDSNQNSLPMIRALAEFERLNDFNYAVGLYSAYCFQNQTALIDFVAPRLVKDYEIDSDKISRKEFHEYFDRVSPARTRQIELALSYTRAVDILLVYLKDMIAMSIYSEPTKFAGNKQLPISEILKHGSLESLIDQYVVAEVERVSYSDISELHKLLKKCDFEAVLKSRDYQRIQQALKVRNRLVHGGGVGQLAISQIRGELPKRETVSRTKFDTDFRFIRNVCRRIDRRAMGNRVFLQGLAKAFPGVYRFDEND